MLRILDSKISLSLLVTSTFSLSMLIFKICKRMNRPKGVTSSVLEKPGWKVNQKTPFLAILPLIPIKGEERDSHVFARKNLILSIVGLVQTTPFYVSS